MSFQVVIHSRCAKLGERPWGGIGLERCLTELIEERLNRAIESILS